MKVLKSDRNENTISLEIEVSHGDIESRMDDAFKNVQKEASLAGFRKGKVPRPVFVKHFGTWPIIEKALQHALDGAYRGAIDELDLKVVDRPTDIDVDQYKEGEPVTFRCSVDVEPVLTLKKYKGLTVTAALKTVDDTMIQEDIDSLISGHATYESVESPAKEEDVVRFDAKAVCDGVPFDMWSRDNQATRIGANKYGEAFDQALIGLKKGDHHTVTVSYSDDDANEAVRGKTIVFDLTVSDVREKQQPELTDELANRINKDCQTADELRRVRKEALMQTCDDENKQITENAVLEALMEANPLVIPETMLNDKAETILRQFKLELYMQKIDFNQYMSFTGETEDNLQNSARIQAKRRIHFEKISDGVVEKEGLSVSDDEVHEALTNEDSSRSTEDWPDGHKDRKRQQLLHEKVMKFLVDSAKIKTVSVS